jgi:hypothetical protein
VAGHRSVGWDVAAAAVGLALLALTAGLTLSFARDFGDTLTRNTIRLSLAAYFAALWLMLHLDAAGWRADSRRGWLCRWLWTWGMLACWLHLAAAFHYHDDWSHRAALERTRLASGVGEGIYASYIFSLVWLLDVLWWWLRPAAYARRSPRLAIGLHSFMLLMVLNATVVFESGPIRWLSVVAFLWLASAWARTGRRA